jgi:cytochrome P450
MFTAQDPVYHKNLKTPVAALFSMTNMRNYEPYADECTDIFMRAMDRKQGQPVDLGEWLQWYAFDVIASITFQRRFSFMEEEKDVKRIIAGLDGGLSYVGIVSQYPGWHPWLMGNRLLVKFLTKLFPDLPDPAGTLMEVC